MTWQIVSDEAGAYYHGAPTAERDRIQTWGLQPQNPQLNGIWTLEDAGFNPEFAYMQNQHRTTEPGVYMAEDPAHAHDYGKEDVWRVSPGYLDEQSLGTDPYWEGGRISPQAIPPEALSLHKRWEDGLHGWGKTADATTTFNPSAPIDELTGYLTSMGSPTSLLNPNNPLAQGAEPSANKANPQMNPSLPGAFNNPSNPELNPSLPGAATNPANPTYNPSMPGAQNNPSNPQFNAVLPTAVNNPSSQQLNPNYPGSFTNPSSPIHNPDYPNPEAIGRPPSNMPPNASFPPRAQFGSKLAWSPWGKPVPPRPTPEELAQGRMCQFHPDRPAVAADGFAPMCEDCYDRWRNPPKEYPWEPVSPQIWSKMGAYYHIAPTTERARIQQHGLQPSDPARSEMWTTFRDEDNPPRGVYISPNREWAGHYLTRLEFQRGVPHDLWEVDDPGGYTYPDPDLGMHSRYVMNSIPSPRLIEGPEHREYMPEYMPRQYALPTDPWQRGSWPMSPEDGRGRAYPQNDPEAWNRMVGRKLAWHPQKLTADIPGLEMNDSRNFSDPTEPRFSMPPAPRGCTCEEGHKLDCPVHGLDPVEPDMDHAWSVPENNPVGFPQSMPRTWSQAFSADRGAEHPVEQKNHSQRIGHRVEAPGVVDRKEHHEKTKDQTVDSSHIWSVSREAWNVQPPPVKSNAARNDGESKGMLVEIKKMISDLTNRVSRAENRTEDKVVEKKPRKLLIRRDQSGRMSSIEEV